MDAPDNIVLVSIDDLRYDCLGSSVGTGWLERYQAEGLVETPTFDRLSNEGTAFQNATSTSSYTPPSHSSMFTGLYPKNHGVKTFFNTLDDGNNTLAEFLSDRGYECRAWVENMALDMLNVTKGFDEVICPFEDEDVDLFDFVEDTNEDKNFLFIHLFDVHKPYMYTTGGTERKRYNDALLSEMNEVLPSENALGEEMVKDAEDEAREAVSNYDGLTEPLQEYAKYRSLDYLLRENLKEDLGAERFKYLVRLYVKGISKFDRGRFSDLMSVLSDEVLEDYLLVTTSDHGEERCHWGDREDLMNSFNVSEGAVRVPLVLDTDIDLIEPEVEPTQTVNHVDLLPSIAEIFKERVDGVDGDATLLSSNGGSRVIFHESWYYSGGVDFFGNIDDPGDGGLSEVAARKHPYKLVRAFSETGSPERALYNISEDPLEETDVREDNPEVVERLEKYLEDFLEGMSLECSPDIDGQDTEELEDRLRALGYLD